MQKERITLIRAGGTINCSHDSSGKLFISEQSTREIIKQTTADTVIDLPYLSENAEFSDYLSVTNAARSQMNSCDRIIITHGTDTFAYAASFAAYALAHTNIPIVLVSSMSPITDADSDASANIKAALSCQQSGVFAAINVAGKSKTVHAARLVSPPLMVHEFTALDCPFKVTDKLKDLNFNFSKRVLFIEPHPAIDYKLISTKGYSAVFHNSYHSGTVNAALFNEFCANQTIPVVLATCGLNYDGQDFSDNVIKVDFVAPPALYVKLMLAVNNGLSLDSFLKENFIGESTPLN